MSISSSKTRSSAVLVTVSAVILVVLSVSLPVVPAPQHARPPVSESHAQPQLEWCQHWSMESRVGQAQLVLVARVSNISAVNIVHGAKVNTTLREYRFQPVSILKGVFTRDELSMTDSDLGLPAPDPAASPPFRHGEHILLILTRTRGSFGCVGLPRGINSPRQLIPRLVDNDDPIVSMTQTMIQISQTSSRLRRVQLSVDRLGQTTGPSAVPLLMSLGTRGYWVQTTQAAKILAGLTADDSPAVRAAAASTISYVLASGAPIKNEARTIFAGALKNLLASDGVETQLRVTALQALGRLDEFGRNTEWVSKLLVHHLQNAQTHDERGAAVTALGSLDDAGNVAVVLKELALLPLDERKERETVFIDAAVRLARGGAGPVLLKRLQQKLSAGHAAHQEIIRLGQLKHHAAIPVLIQSAHDGKHRDETQLAGAFQVLRDERAVPVLAEWLASTNVNTRWAALRALDAVDGKAAVAAIRLRLKSEADLRLKLHMAEVLGRHGIDDGYAIALEHLADPGMTPYAASALAAIDDDRTPGHLWKTVRTSHDTQWNGAALQGLATLRDPEVGDRLVEILSDRRNPLLHAAILATHELNDPALIPAVAPNLLSRNYEVADRSIAAISHLATTAQGHAKHRENVGHAGTALLEVLNDPDIHMKLRIAAFDALRSLRDNRLPRTLRTLADHSQLENTELMRRIDQALAAS